MGLAAATRVVRSFIEQRKEPRIELDPEQNTAILIWRGTSEVVHLGNISASGAMILFNKAPNIGERVVLEMVDRKKNPAQVMWVRGGQAGLSFVNPAR